MSQKQETSTDITPGQVEDYLQRHPEFFNDHLDLLEQLTIPHPSGEAVSLIAKQLEIFRTRHQEIEEQLNTLIDIAKENDVLFDRMHELTLAMLDASTLQEATGNLQHVLVESFHADFVALRLFQERTEDAPADLFMDTGDPRLIHFQDILDNNQPLCIRPTPAQATCLFGDSVLRVKSCAIIPLMFTELEGLLAIGSQEQDRFHYNMGNLFLNQMSEIVGTRLIALLHQQEAWGDAKSGS